MFVFLISQLPLPLMLFLNWRVAERYRQVRRQEHLRPVAKPKRLITGWWLNNAATVVAIIPSAVEWRIFVQDHRWLLLYAGTATMSIIGLTLMNSGLGKELKQISRRRKRRVNR